jgi:hypothetical protein
MTMSLGELARERLDLSKGTTSVEGIWLLSALKSTAEGRPIEPEVDALKQLTTEAQVWEGVSHWPAEYVCNRIVAVVNSHRLAIARHDDDWLTQLHASWEACPKAVDDLWRLRAEGEIGLGLAPGGPRPFGWSDEELSLLDEEGFLRADAPQDRAWRALTMRDFEAARQALMEYEHILAALPQQWEAAPSEGLRQILANPDAIFQVQRRALAALLERARS